MQDRRAPAFRVHWRQTHAAELKVNRKHGWKVHLRYEYQDHPISSPAASLTNRFWRACAAERSFGEA